MSKSASPAASRVSEVKTQEADAQLKEADKLASKTLTRWKPDWEGAAILYEKAANNYKNAKALDKAKEAFKKASNAQYQIDLPFSAAKHMESAAGMAKDLKQNEEGAELYVKACNFYRENGSGFAAAENLAKAAKLIENTDVEKAMDYLKQACELYEIEDKQHFSGDTFKTAVSLFLRHQKFGDTVELLKNQCRVFEKLNQQHDIHKAYLSIIIIHLHCDDYVAANNFYTQFLDTPGFSQSQEGMIAADLLDAFEKRNVDALNACTKKQIFNFLDNQVTKIARGLKISESLVPEHSIGTVSAPPPSNTTTTTAGDGEEDDIR